MSSMLLGPSGSIRGLKSKVRKTVQLIQDNFSFLNSDIDSGVIDGDDSDGEGGRSLKKSLIIYTTSMAIIRRTFENSNKLRNMLYQNWIDFEERDVYLNRRFREELLLKLKKAKSWKSNHVLIPSIFLGDQLLGSLEEVESLNESGLIRSILSPFVLTPGSLTESGQRARNVCPGCGNARFIPCSVCNGSRKTSVHHFYCDSISLRCSNCFYSSNGTGLIQCPLCSTNDSNSPTLGNRVRDRNSTGSVSPVSSNLSSSSSFSLSPSPPIPDH